MSSLGDIVIGLKMDASPFARGAQNAKSSLQSIGQTALSTVSQLAGLIGIGSAIGSIGFGVKLAADAEQAQIAFEVMLGSASAAQKMLGELKAYSDSSPFDTIVPRDVARTLINFGIASNQVLPTIKMLGDVAAGDADKLSRLGLVYGQMSAAGRLMGQDLLQFINAGFNPLQQIAARTGESMLQLKGRMEAGGISASEVAQAFKDATSEGGRFYGMTERQAGTLGGIWSTTKDNVLSTLKTIGDAIIENLDLKKVLLDANHWLGEASQFVKNYGGDIVRLAKDLAVLGAAVGIVVGVMRAYSVIQSIVAAKQVTLMALSGPAGWAAIAAGIATATFAISAMGAQFDEVTRSARAAAEENKRVAQAAEDAKPKNPDPMSAVKADVDRIRQIGQHSPELARTQANQLLGSADVPAIFGFKKVGQAADEATPKMKALYRVIFELEQLRPVSDGFALDRFQAQLNEAIQRERDNISGVTAAIAKQREELEKLKAEGDPDYERNKVKDKGASDGALAEYDALRQQTEMLREQKKLKEQAASEEKQHIDEMKRKAESLKTSTMTAAEKQAQELKEIEELFVQGFIDEETRARAIKQVNKGEDGKPDNARNGAALAGSREAAEIVLRGVGSKGTKLETLTAKSVTIEEQMLAAIKDQKPVVLKKGDV